MLDAGMGALDAGALAAKGVADVAGLQNPEAIAQAVLTLSAKVAEFEKIVPELIAAKEAAEMAVQAITDHFPPGLLDRVHKVIAAVEHRFSI